jgi:hypothetical protein
MPVPEMTLRSSASDSATLGGSKGEDESAWNTDAQKIKEYRWRDRTGNGLELNSSQE